MIRALAPVLMLAALAGCAAVPPPPPSGSYSLGRGIASYDELRRQTELCNSRGGTIEAKDQGDPAQLSNYTCVIPKGKQRP